MAKLSFYAFRRKFIISEDSTIRNRIFCWEFLLCLAVQMLSRHLSKISLRISHIINKSSKSGGTCIGQVETAQRCGKIQLQCGLQVFLQPLQNRVPRGAGALWAPVSADPSGAKNQVLLPLPPKRPPRLALNRHSWGLSLCFWLVGHGLSFPY